MNEKNKLEDTKKIWEESNWTYQARQIIVGINEFSKNSKIILIIRHSHRKESKNIEEIGKLGLTSQGHQIAKIFGGFLPKNRLIRLFYSISSRCRETAEDILTGFQKKNGKGELKGPLTPLYDMGSSGDFITSQAFKYSGNGFIIRWAVGLYPPKLISPLTIYCQNSANIIWNQLDNAAPNSIDIHITHDLHLMGLRLGWFGYPPNKDWVSYLGGFAFTFQENQILILEDGKLSFSEFPYWWQSIRKF